MSKDISMETLFLFTWPVNALDGSLSFFLPNVFVYFLSAHFFDSILAAGKSYIMNAVFLDVK